MRNLLVFGKGRGARQAQPLMVSLFLCSALLAFAQTPSNPASGTQAPASGPVLHFRIRSAFSLTPEMVRGLQAKSAEVNWGEPLAKSLPFAAPLDVRLVGKNVVALIQIVPIALRAEILDLIVQGQVWVKMPDDSLSYKTTLQSLSLPLGSRLFFYPLGVDAKTGTPIAVEIRVDREIKP